MVNFRKQKMKIEIDEAVFETLCKNRVKFETPNEVMKRMLKITVTSKNDFIPQKDYRNLLLKVLMDAGGRLSITDATYKVGQLTTLNDSDWKKLKSGKIRWRNFVAWSRNSLVREGYIHPPEVSGKGVWSLTEAGKSKAKSI